MNPKVNKKTPEKKSPKNQAQAGTDKLTKREKELLQNPFYMAPWQIKHLIADKCLRVSSRILGYEKNGKDEVTLYAYIYCLAGSTDQQKSVAANFFIAEGYRLFQAWDIERALKVLNALHKEHKIKKSEKKKRSKLIRVYSTKK